MSRDPRAGTPSSVPGKILGLLSPSATSDERLLSARLRVYVGSLGAFALGFAVHDYVRNRWVYGAGPAPTGMLVVLFGIGMFASGLAIFLRGRRLSLPWAELLDLGVTATLAAGLALMHLLADPGARTVGLLPGLLLVLVSRAAIIPTRSSRTLVLGLAATSLNVWAAWQSGSRHGYAAADWAWVVGIWGIAFSIASALVARVIYRLRGEVEAAQRLGEYTLEEPIGAGAMGMVYRARHHFLKRPAALKTIRPDRVGASTIARFEREVQQTALLSHPNAVVVFDYGRTPDGIFYYVMELLEGVDLQSLVETHGPQPPGRVIHLVAQAASALEAAHRRGLVHRDVKPANLVVTGQTSAPDLVKVVDFGLVKELGAEGHGPGHDARPRAAGSFGEATLSGPGRVVGTPLYMAPESIVSPDEVDARADLYALACTAWFLLVGRPPFIGHSAVEVCAAHLHEKPRRPSEVLGTPLPADLEAVVLGSLAKDPEDRPASALALRAALLGCACAKDWDEECARRWWAGRGTTPPPPVSDGPVVGDPRPASTLATALPS
ncbi:MAG TPA: serine/threonine-protein kinase [Polyangiaceae bacterium LLY-WYZ-14_1]|nr:serine/threonine-protein kinase [Polyangiaceae bacterium LLY-WYZ-14_1]